MGPGIRHTTHPPCTNDRCAALLARADAELAHLADELELRTMQASHAHARLLALGDDAEAQRARLGRELERERRAKERLSEKLDRFLDEVRRAERERDELKEIVSIVLKKAEAAANFALWPHPQMWMPSPLDPPSREPRASTSRNTLPDEDDEIALQLQLASALRAQLDAERRAHALTKDTAEAEILRLRAMLALRDAELEAAVSHRDHLHLHHQPSSSSSATARKACTRPACVEARRQRAGTDAPENRASAAELLALTSSRNRALEAENGALRERISREARQAGPSGSQRPAVAAPQRATNGSSGRMDAQSAPATPRGRRKHSPPETPRAAPSPSPDPTPRPRRPSPKPSDPRGATVSLEREPDLKGPLGQLDQQIAALSEQIVAFKKERDALRDLIARNLPEAHAMLDTTITTDHDDDNAELPDNFTREFATPLEREYIQVVRERTALRYQLEDTTEEFRKRELALQAELDTLRRALSDTGTVHAFPPPPSSLHPPTPPPRTSTSPPRTSTPPPPPPPRKPSPPPPPRRPPTPRRRTSTPPPRTPSPSGLSEASMDLETPLRRTIISLRDTDEASLRAHPYARLAVEPAHVPLPESPPLPIVPPEAR